MYWMDRTVPGGNCGHAGWKDWSGDVSGAYCCKTMPPTDAPAPLAILEAVSIETDAFFYQS